MTCLPSSWLAFLMSQLHVALRGLHLQWAAVGECEWKLQDFIKIIYLHVCCNLSETRSSSNSKSNFKNCNCICIYKYETQFCQLATCNLQLFAAVLLDLMNGKCEREQALLRFINKARTPLAFILSNAYVEPEHLKKKADINPRKPTKSIR